MKPISNMVAASAMLLGAFALTGIAAPAAQAGEYCINDSSIFKGCGFTTLAQCQATASGTGGTCSRDPGAKDAGAALAYDQPKTAARARHSVAR